MYLIVITIALFALKYFEVWKFANMSWWWPIGAFALAFFWFEFVEKTLGLDKRKAHDEFDRLRKDRIKKQFDMEGKKKR